MGETLLSKLNKLLIFLIALCIFLLSLYIFYLSNSTKARQRIIQAEKTLKGAVEFVGMTVHENFFRDDNVYRAVIQEDEVFLKQKLQEIIDKYPNVIRVYIQEVEQEYLNSLEIFTVDIVNGNFRLSFKICKKDLSAYVSGKLARVILNAQQFINSLGFDDIQINGASYEYSGPLISSLEILTSALIALCSTFIFAFVARWRKLNLEKRYHEKLHRRTLCQEAILNFTKIVLSGQVEDSYQFLLEKAVELVPGAQAGSLLMKKNDVFVLTHVAGYDPKIAGKMFFKPHELAQQIDGRIRIIKDLHQINTQNLDEVRKEFLYSVDKVAKIKSLLSIPIIAKDEVVAFLNLDNFENENAFNEEAVNIAELFAGHVGVLFERMRLEEELKIQKQLMEYLSYHDPLTDLPNRRMLEEYVEKTFAIASRENKPVCVIYMDLYKFKDVNDTFGHPVGDDLLKILGNRLKKEIRRGDMVARFGGDEFVFVLYDVSVEGAIEFSRRLLEFIQKPIVLQNKIFTISANLGIAVYPADGDNFETVLRNADMALYTAKRKEQPFAIFSQISQS